MPSHFCKVTLEIEYDPDECLNPAEWSWEDVLSVQMNGKNPQVLSVIVLDDETTVVIP